PRTSRPRPRLPSVRVGRHRARTSRVLRRTRTRPRAREDRVCSGARWKSLNVMCGIAGLIGADTQRPIRKMAAALMHRGPDAEGFVDTDGASLAARRLRIIDIAGPDQPLFNEDRSIVSVFNGEIYNYRELRRFLESKGHRFHTAGDTEVIVLLYEEFGDECVHALRGMFAFAVWDSRRRRLLLARDRVGIKPLYFCRDAEKIVFGSELKAILAHGSAPRTIDPAALEDYLAFGVVPGPRTIFAGIEKLP